MEELAAAVAMAAQAVRTFTRRKKKINNKEKVNSTKIHITYSMWGVFSLCQIIISYIIVVSKIISC